MVRLLSLPLLLLWLTSGCGGGCDKGAPPIASKPNGPAAAPAADAPSPPDSPAPPAPPTPASTATATVSGSIRWAGATPTVPLLDRSRDPKCPQTKVPGPWLEVAAGKVQNVVVWVDVPMGGELAPPKAPAFIDQKGCAYRPFVTAIVAGQRVRVRNSDDTFHNVHGTQGERTAFNEAHVPGTDDKILRLDIGGVAHAMKLVCDVHPWMEAWVVDFPHPFFAVTRADGSFTLSGLPGMKATVHAWHPYLGEKTVGVVANPGETATAEITFSAADYKGPKP